MLPALQRESSSVSMRVVTGPHGVAFALIAQTIDATGHVDTVRLGLWVADAMWRDFARAAQAYSAIEAQLLARSSAEVARFNQDLVEAALAELREGSGRTGRAKRRTNPVLLRQWESAQSAYTGVASFTADLQTLLESHGIALPRERPVRDRAVR